MTGRSQPGRRTEVDLILDVGPVAPPLTGIGHYSLELARRLPETEGVGTVHFTANGRWIGDVERRLASPPSTRMPRSAPLQAVLRPVHYLYRIARDARQAYLYRRHSDAIFHGTNFEVPDFPGPSVVTVHDLSVLRFPQFHPVVRVDVMERAFERLSERAHFLVAISEFTRREVIDLLDWPEDRIRAIHLGVRPGFRPRSPDETRAVLDRLGLTHGGYVLCVASIEPRKNITGLIAAYAGLPAELKRRFPLVLSGHSGWNSRQTHRDIRRFAREGWLHYVGYLPDSDLPMLMGGALGFVYPSFYEGFGLPVVEAMASGVPVVTSDRSSLPEVTSGAALLVDPENREELVAALRRLLEDREWREEAAARSLTVAGRYTWEATVRRTVEVYHRVANDPASPPLSGKTAVRANHGSPAGPAARDSDESTSHT